MDGMQWKRKTTADQGEEAAEEVKCIGRVDVSSATGQMNASKQSSFSFKALLCIKGTDFAGGQLDMKLTFPFTEPATVRQMVQYASHYLVNKDYQIEVHGFDKQFQNFVELGMQSEVDDGEKYEILMKPIGSKSGGHNEEMGEEGTGQEKMAEEMKEKIEELEEKFQRKCSELTQIKGKYKEREEVLTKDWEDKLDEKTEYFQEKLEEKKKTENQLNAKLEEAQNEVKRLKAANENLVKLNKSADLVIIESELSKKKLKVAKKCVRESLEKCDTEWEMAEYIKEYFDWMYEGNWHCFIGRLYYDLLPDEHSFIKFGLGQTTIVLFKGS